MPNARLSRKDDVFTKAPPRIPHSHIPFGFISREMRMRIQIRDRHATKERKDRSGRGATQTGTLSLSLKIFSSTGTRRIEQEYRSIFCRLTELFKQKKVISIQQLSQHVIVVLLLSFELRISTYGTVAIMLKSFEFFDD